MNQLDHVEEAPLCPCGKPIAREPGETVNQHERRLESGYCRAKCKRLYPRPRRVVTLDTPAKTAKVIPIRGTIQTGPRHFTGSLFKEVPWRSQKYTDFVRAQPCCVTDTPGPSDPHHEQEEAHGGMSTKCGDDRQVPLRHDKHVMLETPGNSRPACWAKWKKDPEKIIKELHEKYFRLTGEYPGWN